jgi:hypothetical protein
MTENFQFENRGVHVVAAAFARYSICSNKFYFPCPRQVTENKVTTLKKVVMDLTDLSLDALPTSDKPGHWILQPVLYGLGLA